jgi:predicted nucleic acid-binding protein
LIVVDASFLTDFLWAARRASTRSSPSWAGREHEPLHAPELIEPETLNALRRLAAGGSVSDRRASEAASDLANTRIIRYPHAPLRERVWELRHNLTAYDATYLALAEALDDPVLLTADGALAAHARQSLSDERVRHVE